MPIEVTCDACGARFKAPDSAAGKKGKCKKCGAVISVPVPEPVGVPEAEPDDLYDVAEPAPAPAKSYRPAATSLSDGIAAAPPYRPPPPISSSPTLAYGVPAKNPNAGAWRNSHNPPKSFQILKGIGGAVLLLLGLAIAGGAVYGLMNPEKSLRRPFKGLFFGLFLLVMGAGLLARSMGIGGVFDED